LIAFSVHFLLGLFLDDWLPMMIFPLISFFTFSFDYLAPSQLSLAFPAHCKKTGVALQLAIQLIKSDSVNELGFNIHKEL
jgi:hypothetical protein